MWILGDHLWMVFVYKVDIGLYESWANVEYTRKLCGREALLQELQNVSVGLSVALY